jgi:hypothetical protein
LLASLLKKLPSNHWTLSPSVLMKLTALRVSFQSMEFRVEVFDPR